MPHWPQAGVGAPSAEVDRKSTRLNSSHANISYAVFCLKKKKHNPVMYLFNIVVTYIDRINKTIINHGIAFILSSNSTFILYLVNLSITLLISVILPCIA